MQHSSGVIENPVQKNFTSYLDVSYLRDYYCVITDINNAKLTISGTPPPTLEDFTTIPKSPKGKILSHPTRYLQKVNMDIDYEDCVVLGGN